MDRNTLITLAAEFRGKPGINTIRKHLQDVTHAKLRAELPLVLQQKDRVE